MASRMAYARVVLRNDKLPFNRKSDRLSYSMGASNAGHVRSVLTVDALFAALVEKVLLANFQPRTRYGTDSCSCMSSEAVSRYFTICALITPRRTLRHMTSHFLYAVFLTFELFSAPWVGWSGRYTRRGSSYSQRKGVYPPPHTTTTIVAVRDATDRRYYSRQRSIHRDCCRRY